MEFRNVDCTTIVNSVVVLLLGNTCTTGSYHYHTAWLAASDARRLRNLYSYPYHNRNCNCIRNQVVS